MGWVLGLGLSGAEGSEGVCGIGFALFPVPFESAAKPKP